MNVKFYSDFLRGENRMEENKNTAITSDKKHLFYDDYNRISFEIIKVLHNEKCTYEDAEKVLECVSCNLTMQSVQAT